MRVLSAFLVFCLMALAGCTTMGFDPRHDGGVALARANTPRDQKPEDLRKQDPRASLSLKTDPYVEEGYRVLTVAVKDMSPLLLREIEDSRQSYAKYVAEKIEIKEGAVVIILQCKDGKPSCSDVSDVKTMKVPLHRKVWRAAVYGFDNNVEKIYDAVYRPKLKRFLVLIPLDEWANILGKEVRILGAYGDFSIARDGTFSKLEDRDVATFPSGSVKLPVKGDDMVLMTRNEPAGKFFLDLLAGEFPFRTQTLFYNSGAAHPDLYLGATKLTPEENGLDCWVRNGGGQIMVTPFPQQMAVSFIGSVLWSLPRITSRDCGVK